MTKGQTQVREFMRFFGQDTPKKPTNISAATAKLRAQLILEEAIETITKGLGLAIYLVGRDGREVGIHEDNLGYWFGDKGLPIEFEKVKEVNLKETVDGLADLAYVGDFGTAVAVGVDLEPIQDIVHASNMTKAWKFEDLEEAKRLYPTAKVEDYGNNLYRLIREDGKVIKSPHFVAPDAAIEKELERQKGL